MLNINYFLCLVLTLVDKLLNNDELFYQLFFAQLNKEISKKIWLSTILAE